MSMVVPSPLTAKVLPAPTKLRTVKPVPTKPPVVLIPMFPSLIPLLVTFVNVILGFLGIYDG
jgi:hypothetical protein